MAYNPFSVSDKTILVTGASSGIGRATSVELSRMGARVVLFGRNPEKLNQTLSLLSNKEIHLHFAFDLMDEEARKNVISEIKKRIDYLDALVHCAGISSTSVLRSLKIEKLNKHFEINVNSGFMLAKELISKKNALIGSGASIVFLSSVMASVGEVGKMAYAMSKGAVLAGVKSMALELAEKEIRVNAVSPGVVETPMSSSSFYSKNEERLEKIKNLHPLGLGKPQDVAHACVYLASDASRWVTGSNLLIDGGYTAR